MQVVVPNKNRATRAVLNQTLQPLSNRILERMETNAQNPEITGIQVNRQGRRRGRPSRQEAEQLDRDLLAQALDHFMEKGFEGTTIDAITSSLGMSKRTVYNRYDDKLELFKAALQRGIEDWLAPFETLPDLESDDLETTLIDVSREIVKTLNSPLGVKFIRITNAESYRMPEIGRLLYFRGHQVISRYLVDLFQRRIFVDASPEIDVKELASAFLNLMSSPARLIAWGLQTEQPEIEEFVRTRVRLFLHGALPLQYAAPSGKVR